MTARKFATVALIVVTLATAAVTTPVAIPIVGLALGVTFALTVTRHMGDKTWTPVTRPDRPPIGEPTEPTTTPRSP